MTLANTLKINEVTTFRHLSNFESLKDLNNNMEQILLDYKPLFTKPQLIALKHLLRFCAKVKGVATASICKLVSATFKDGKMGISRKTFERMLAKAIKLGILTVYNGERWNGSQSSNIYVFNRYETVKKHAEQQSHQASEVVGIVSESQTTDVPKQRKLTHLKALSLLKHLVFKQEKSVIESPMENRFESFKNDREKTLALLQEYKANDYQLQLYDLIMDMPFPSSIHEVAGVLTLITGKDCDAQKKIKAYQVIWSIASNMNDGVQIDSVKAVFRERMDMPIDRYKEIKARNVIKAVKPRTVKRVPFYNWLNERD